MCIWWCSFGFRCQGNKSSIVFQVPKTCDCSLEAHFQCDPDRKAQNECQIAHRRNDEQSSCFKVEASERCFQFTVTLDLWPEQPIHQRETQFVSKIARGRGTLHKVKLSFSVLLPPLLHLQFFIWNLSLASTSFCLTRVTYILRLMMQTWSDSTTERFRQGQRPKAGGGWAPVCMGAGNWEKQTVNSKWKRRCVWTGNSQPGSGIAYWGRLLLFLLCVCCYIGWSLT